MGWRQGWNAGQDASVLESIAMTDVGPSSVDSSSVAVSRRTNPVTTYYVRQSLLYPSICPLSCVKSIFPQLATRKGCARDINSAADTHINDIAALLFNNDYESSAATQFGSKS